MAKRTTRQKIQYHARKLPEHLDRMTEDVAAIADLADNRSPYVTDSTPAMIVAIEEFRKMIQYFYKGL